MSEDYPTGNGSVTGAARRALDEIIKQNQRDAEFTRRRAARRAKEKPRDRSEQ